MRELLAVFAVLGVAAAIPLLGKEQCVQGPPVWCVNIRSAKQCNAVTHCQQTVWSRPTVNSVPCEFCKEVVTVVAGYLKDNATQQTILSTLEKICELIPDPSIGSECKQLIEEYYQLVINMIQEEMSNPGTVCCALGLCKSMQQHLASLQNPKQLLSNEIPDVQLDRLAPFMANVPLLLYPQEKKTEEKVKTEAKDVCQDCLQLVLDVQDNLRGNTSFSRMLIENFLKQCDQYGGGFADVCKEYVNQYGDLVIQMIIQLHQPSQQICNGIGLCAAKDTAPPKEVIPAKLLVPAMKVQPAMELKPAMKVASKSSEESLPVCEMCKLVVEKVEDLLKDERTEARIQQALDKVCQILPSKYRAKCVDFVDTNLPALLQLFLQAAPPRAICLVLGCCSSREPKMVKLAADKPQSEVCEVCKMMMNYLESLLEKNDTEQKIEQALEKVCNFVPPSMFDECHQLIEQYGAMILQMLLQQIKPDLCCKELGFCPNTQKKLLGVEKCMWGPSYWCKDLETAGSCNAIEHCKRHVWS